MALWDKISSRGNVVDRRAMAPIVGGIGVGGVLIYVLVSTLLGEPIDVGQILGEISESQEVAQQNFSPEQFEGQDSYEEFASIVLGSNDDAWESVFSSSNQTYLPPTLVLFRTATLSACGTATSEVGPHYCPLDSTIYLDETFFDELTNLLGAEGGDVAQAYVIAHEVGHHIQRQLGILDQVQQLSQANPSQANALSVALELQADCFAGLWAHSIKDTGVFLPGEISEAMDAAAAVGDDRIQEKVIGSIQPENWTHGSSDQRVTWFTTGYESGTLSSCNTFGS